jgi:putative MATE family efflux protein
MVYREGISEESAGSVSALPAPLSPGAPALHAPVWRQVVLLALPVLAQQFLVFMVGTSDRFLAGHFEPKDHGSSISYQAAQTSGQYMLWVLTSYCIVVSAGATALVARFVGAGDRELAVRATNQSILLAMIFGLGGSAACLLGLKTLVRILLLEGEAADHTGRYLVPLFVLLVFQMIEAVGIACLVGAGDTKTGMWVLGGVALLNVPLGWGLYHGLGPLPELGFPGIALGTGLSHTLGAMAVLGVLAHGRKGLQLRLRYLWPDLGLMWRLLRVSLPAGADSMSLAVCQMWFLSIVNRVGDDAGSAHGIAIGWEALGYLSGAAFGTAAMSLVGRNLGAGQPQNAARCGWTALAMGCTIMTLMGCVFFVFAPQMFLLYCPRPEQARIVELGVPVLRLVAFAMPALSCTVILTSALRGAGDTRVPVLFTWIGFLGVRIPLAYWLSSDTLNLGPLGTIQGLNLGLFGAWLAMFADLFVRAAFFLHRFLSGKWQRVRV